MTKFFLHWWVTSPRTEKNKKFFQEVVRAGWNRVLIFPFAQKDRNYDLQFEVDSQKFIDHNPDIDIECAMASDDIDILIWQIKEYKLLYFCGGMTKYHLEILKQIDNLKELLKDKVVSGNSAWSMVWTRYTYDQDIEWIVDALWILNVKMIVHWWTNRYYGRSDEDRLKELKQYWEDLPIYKIREQEYEVFEI